MQESEKLIISRIDTGSSGLVLVQWIMYIMCAFIGLMGILLGEIVVIFIGLGFVLLTYLFMRLLDAEKVIFGRDSIKLTFFGFVKRNFAKKDIVEIGAYESIVTAPRAVSVKRSSFTKLKDNDKILGFGLVLISLDSLPDTFNPTLMAGKKRAILFNYNEKAVNFLEKYYSDKMK